MPAAMDGVPFSPEEGASPIVVGTGILWGGGFDGFAFPFLMSRTNCSDGSCKITLSLPNCCTMEDSFSALSKS